MDPQHSSSSRTAKVHSFVKAVTVSRLRPGPAEIVTLCLYAGLLAWAVPYHEPWADEAQAWQIARTLPLRRMFSALAFEGHPGLWYLCLWALSRLHIGYAGIHWVAAAIAFVGVSVLVLAAPFPRFIKLLLPFTFFLAFQYAIVARGYVLAPLLLFACAYFWPQRMQHPLRIALCLGLLANVALHAAMISGGLFLVYLIELWRGRREDGALAREPRLYAAAAVLLIFYGSAIWVAFPAKDASGGAFNVRPNPEVVLALSTQQAQLPPLITPEPSNKRSLKWLAWKIEIRLAGGLSKGLVGQFWLASLFWVFMTWKLLRTRKLRYLIPSILFVVFCAYVEAVFWHSGLMLLCVITSLWMTWPPQDLPFLKLPLYEQLPVLMLLVFALLQISWAEFAFRFDHEHDYAPSKASAAYLDPYVHSDAHILEIGDDFLSAGLQPYFDHNIFLNQPYGYYWWSIRNPAKLRYQQLLAQHPQVVIVEWRFHKPPTAAEVAASVPPVTQLAKLGYRGTHTFCGGLIEPGREVLEWDCELIYQPDGRGSVLQGGPISER